MNVLYNPDLFILICEEFGAMGAEQKLAIKLYSQKKHFMNIYDPLNDNPNNKSIDYIQKFCI